MDNDPATIEWLSKAIRQATKAAKFCVAGCLPVVDPGLVVDGLGTIQLPLNRKLAKQFVAACLIAPYGKGTQTLVDKKVRNTFELDPKKFRLSDEWNSAVAHTTRVVAEQLGLSVEQLEARLYKLLVYEKGGFFLPHRDSEKHDRMVASLIVALPNPFSGGTLIVRHGAARQSLTFSEAASGTAPSYAAFYADCEHEVQRVTGGVRLCLAYNLVLKAKRAKPSSAVNPAQNVEVLAESIKAWTAKRPAEPLVFALEHHYTQRGLSLDLLKGTDRQLAKLVVSGAEKADCVVHLAQVSRHLLQFADDGSFGRAYSRHDPSSRRAIEIGETYEDALSGTQWTDAGGRKQLWGEIAFELSSIVSSTPIDDWTPTSETFEGYTGNAGNTLDRWYHRSAIIVWHRDHHFEVVASSGANDSIPLLCSMAAKLTKTPKKRFEESRLACLRFARAIIHRWPSQTIHYDLSTARESSPFDAFAEVLLTLSDRDTIAMFLLKLAEQDPILRLSSFVVAACREFGWNAFAQELKRLISARHNTRRRQEIPLRDVEWLSAYCCDVTADPTKSALALELGALAVERFCEPPPPQPTYYRSYYRRELSVSEKSLPLLLQALAASGRDEDLSRVIRFVQEFPNDFSMDDCQVPCLRLLIPWSLRQFGQVHPQFASWLFRVRQQLETATARKPTPPTDSARPADVKCNCPYCAQLKTFLADPAREVGRISAREDLRQHLIGMIDRHQCDVTHTLERKGSPFSLVLTKTTGSYKQSLARFITNRKLLDSLPVHR